MVDAVLNSAKERMAKTCSVYERDNGKIYKSSTLVNNEPTGEVVGNGTYAEAAQPLEDLSDPDNVEYYLPVVVISGGKITRRYEFRRLS